MCAGLEDSGVNREQKRVVLRVPVPSRSRMGLWRWASPSPPCEREAELRSRAWVAQTTKRNQRAQSGAVRIDPETSAVGGRGRVGRLGRTARGVRMRGGCSRLPSFVPMVNMTPAERVAERTWSTLGLAQQLRARFGEETLTDLLVLDMLPHRHAKGFWLLPTTKPAEALCGADLFVAVRHQTGRWSPLRAPGQEAGPERQLPDVERGAKVRQSITQARTVRAAATRPAPLPALQPLEHRSAFRALALPAGFRRGATGLHARPELAHSADDLPSAPPELRPSSQGQSVQTMALCF